MTRKHAGLILAFSLLIFIAIAGIIPAVFGLEVFIFGRKFTEFIGVIAAAAAVLICIFVLSLISEYSEKIPKIASVVLRVLIIAFTVIFSFLFLAVSAFFTEKRVYRNISDDRRHEVIISEDSTFGGYNAVLYRRYSPFLKGEEPSFYIDDLAGEPDFTVDWYEDGCSVTYEHYSEYLGAEPTDFTQRLYFNNQNIEQ